VLSLDNATVAILDVALFNKTVHVVDPPLIRIVGEHTKPVNWTGDIKLKENILLALPYTAVITATWSAVSPTLVTVKLSEVCPAARMTLAGTVRLALLLESATRAPPASAGEVRETVHKVLPGVFIVVVVQPIPVSLGCKDRETEPLPIAAGIEVPATVVAITAVT
jgi:hypothetical protein